MNTLEPNYFEQAKTWADDFYISCVTSRNQWRALSLFILSPIVILLLICLVFLIPTQHLEPLMINHYSDGETLVTPIKQAFAPSSPEVRAEIESNITQYIRFRESYSVDTYDYAYRLIHLMSSENIYNEYEKLQSIRNKNSPINLLGNKGYKSVKIQSILFLDNKNKNLSDNKNKTRNLLSQIHHNLAEVNFVVTNHDKNSDTTTSTPLTVLISWQYKGMPSDPSARWMDWNGFTVTHYEVSQRNI